MTSSRLYGWLCAVLLGLGCGCATTAQKLDDAYAPSTTLYVAPFVDFTEHSGGVDLMVALQNHIYRAAPERFSYVFDEEALCIDGTIHAVEVHTEGKRLSVEVEVSAVLLRFDGSVVHDLGSVRRERTWRASKNRLDNDAQQRQALRVVWHDVAKELLQRMAAPPT